jgi:hypothetical protein
VSEHVSEEEEHVYEEEGELEIPQFDVPDQVM